MTEEAAHAAHSPLAQFEVHSLIPFHLGGYDLSFTNASLWMVVAAACATLFMMMGVRSRQLVPGRWQGASEMLVDFVSDIVTSNAGKEGLKFFPLIFSLFIFILFCNLCGMIPTSFTVTSHIIVTFALALILFVGITIVGFVKHGTHFLSLFLPAGTPWWMVPLMVMIELVSYMARPISLSIRLAANMLAGHLLLKIVAGFVMIGVLGIFPMAFLLIFTGFEIFIACLQAYIFTLLICIYLNDALHLH
ncbi:MAG: F0F1 ATP synthase subunit A [Alphaproteobacteria bacterium]|nr:F0F1 ATP synthase subunit A [Alphaproteobacteria bacterium]